MSQAYNYLAKAQDLINKSRFDEAFDEVQSAYALAPEDPRVLSSMAYMLRHRGNTEEAIKHLNKALEIDLANAMSLYNLSYLTKYEKGNLEHERLLKRLKLRLKDKLSINEEISLRFAIARALDQLEEYDQAWREFTKANQLQKTTLNYSKDDLVYREKYALKYYSKDFLESISGTAFEDDLPVPIFIVGMPRSGSSLIEQILSYHSEVYGAGEVFLFQQVLESCDPGSLRKEYLSALRRLDADAKFICDKLPSNLWHLGLIKAIMPEAIIIHSTRDPLNTCLSCYQQDFRGGHYYSTDLEDLAIYFNSYSRIMKYWQGLGLDIYELNYEKLVENQEEETRKLLEYCGLAWEPQCLEFYRNKRHVATASTAQVREPINRNSLDKAKNYEQHLAGLKQALL